MGALYCLIGDPVEHSVSPHMFNAAFRDMGLDDHLYVALRVGRRELKSFISSSKLIIGLRGFNVTIPHKITIAEFMDRLQSEAREVGAVNTVKISGGSLHGFNTDVMAIRRILPRRQVKGSTALILGVGGAARAAAIALRDLGCLKQVFIGRRAQRIHDMAKFAEDRGIDYEQGKFRPSDLRRHSGSCGVIVNATPVGMYPRSGATPLPADYIRNGSLVFDMVYNPPVTRLLRDARRRGASTVGGLEMLIAQAVEAYRIWLGRRPDDAVMKRAALRGLRRFGV